MQGAQLVPVKIAKIGQIELTRATLAHARGTFAGRATSRKASRMPGISLLGRRSGKADRQPVGAGRVRTVDGLCDRENAWNSLT